VRALTALAAIAGLAGTPASGAPPPVAEEIELRLASAVMPAWVAPDDRSGAQWAVLQHFYKARGYAPVWTSETGLLPAAAALVELVEGTRDQGLDPRRYASGLAAAAAGGGLDWPTALANRDLQISHVFVRLAQDLLEGRVRARGASAYWAAAPVPETDAEALLRAAAERGPAAALAPLGPPHAQYAALLRALAEHRAIVDAGGWPQLPADPRPRRGRKDPRLRVLRERLAISGDLASLETSGDPDVLDRPLQKALKGFQLRHGLAPDGRLGPATLRALNVPASERVAQIELNLERWRWLPRDLGQRYVQVNVPAFELHAEERGRAAERMKVVTGEAGETPTPIFSAEMASLTFSPWWNVPPRMTEVEILPAIRRNPSYLRRRGLLAVGGGAGVQFRQPPGPTNPMGGVKFLFPNPFNVYLHDTPDDRAFAAARRDLSHGCMRVERPVALARWVLQDRAAWPDARIRAAMRSGSESSVALPEPIPVHVVYFTAWVEADGAARFLPDVYGHDEPQLALLRGEGPWQRLAAAMPGTAAP
jgi:L,D-transpeptidase YcbB